MCKKIKLDTSVDLYTIPSPSKAIQRTKCELNKKIKLRNTDKTLLKKSCNEKNIVENNHVVPSINAHTTPPKQVDTKDHLGVTALIALMEPATESPASRTVKHPRRSCTSKQIKVLLDSGSSGDLYFLKSGKHKPFPYLTRQVPKSWYTSNGCFQTTGRGKIKVKFFECSASKEIIYNQIL